MRRRVLAAAVALVAVGGIALASASTLGVDGPTLSTAELTHPCPGVSVATPAQYVGATNRYRAISLTVPSGCGPRAVQVQVQNGTGWRTATATVDGSAVIRLNANYTAQTTTAVRATMDGWDLPVTWSFARTTCVVPTGEATCDSDVQVFVGSKPGGGNFTYYDVTVSTDSPTPVPWEVTILMSHPDLPGVPNQLGNSTLDAYNDGQTTWSNAGNVNDVQRISACANSPVLVVAGKPSGPAANRYETVVAGRDRLFSLVLNYDVPQYRDVFWPGCT